MAAALSLRKVLKATFGREQAAAPQGASSQAYPVEEMVRAIQLAATGMPPTAEELASGLAKIGRDHASIDGYIAEVRHRAAFIARELKQTLPDHSQYGEFPMLLRELVAAASTSQIIVDVGANGRMGSNSYDLLTDYGWRGLLIEANPMLAPRIETEFAGTDYTLVKCAIGVTSGRQVLHFGVDDQISSLNLEDVLVWGEQAGGIEVDVRRLADVLEDQSIPHDFDILSMDIEGFDAAVLNDLIATSPYRPRWIVVEIAMSFETSSLAETALSPRVIAEYELVGRTLPNLILRRRSPGGE